MGGITDNSLASRIRPAITAGSTAKDVRGFGDTAKSLARNPLGIIALFIVLVYGFACLVTAFSSSFTPAQKTPLIYFLVIFPVLVLGVFSWLVSRHTGKLFAPVDFKDEKNYVRMQLSAAASLAVATATLEPEQLQPQISKIIDTVQKVKPADLASSRNWNMKILWVDDRPRNNTYQRQAFEALGVTFTLALSTSEALEHLSDERFAAIISDMARREGPREGYVLLEAIRRKRDKTPFFIYSGSNAPAQKVETAERGGQGCTNNAQELFQMVTRTLMKR